MYRRVLRSCTSDVLRVEVTGPVGIHLTVVDLPGLISVADDEQTEDDVRKVQDVVDSLHRIHGSCECCHGRFGGIE